MGLEQSNGHLCKCEQEHILINIVLYEACAIAHTVVI